MSGRSGTPWTQELAERRHQQLPSWQLPRAPLMSTWAQRAGTRRGRAGVVRGGGAWAREGREGEARREAGAEGGARVWDRSSMRVGPLRAREGGCGAGRAHLRLDLSAALPQGP